MTDKEQIIIDGVNILDCDNYYVEQETDQVKCYLSGEYCRENKNCFYKQLARKTQECEELKIRLMQNDEVNTFFNTPIEGWSSDPCNICESKNNYEQLKQECEIWKKQVLILDEESVTVQVTQEQFEEYRKLKQELNFARNEVHQKTEYIKEQRDIIDQLKQECEELKEKNVLLESQMAFNLSEMGIRLGNEVNRSETLLKELKRFDKIKDEFREMSEKLKSENDHYRKALEEFEEVLKDEICEECPGEEGCKGGCKEHQCLNIINKVKGEGKCQ